MKFTINHKQAGKKIKLTVTDEAGNVIGERTSARAYEFALIVETLKEETIKRELEEAALQDAEAERYESLSPYGRVTAETIAEWVTDLQERSTKKRALAAEMQAGLHDDKFGKPYVTSWHGKLSSVPAVAPHCLCKIVGVARLEA